MNSVYPLGVMSAFERLTLFVDNTKLTTTMSPSKSVADAPDSSSRSVSEHDCADVSACVNVLEPTNVIGTTTEPHSG